MLVLPQSWEPLFATNFAQVSADPLKFEQFELDSMHPAPFVMHPCRYEVQAESVEIFCGALAQVILSHGEPSNKHMGLYALQSASELAVAGAPEQSPSEQYAPLLN